MGKPRAGERATVGSDAAESADTVGASVTLRRQQLESLGVVTRRVAHQLNNHLMSLMGRAELATVTLSARHPAVAQLALAEQAARQAGELCQQLLAYAEDGRARAELELSAVVRGLDALLRAVVARNVELRLELAESLPRVPACSSQIRQVVVFLALSAAEAIGEGDGVVRISTRRAEARFVELEVADDGPEIPARTLARVLELRDAAEGGGRGAALVAARLIAERHGGALRVLSRAGVGSSVRILLPPGDDGGAAPR